ncbi:MAG: sugar phosphate isomerase/epimerase family protein [Phycisphaerae bacterium]
MKPIALQLYSVRDYAKDDFPAILEKIASFGYAGVEFAGLHGFEPVALKKVIQDLGLKGVSTHQGDVTSDNINEIVETANALGYDNIVIPFRPGDFFATPQAIGQLAGQLEAMAALLKPHGLTLSYHNHAHEMQTLDGTHAFEILLEKAPSLHAQIDSYWASAHGKYDPAEFVGKWANRCRSVHIKDGPLEPDTAMKAVGQGKMDIPAVVKAAEVDSVEWLIVELDSCDTDMMEAVRESAAYLIGEGLAKGR